MRCCIYALLPAALAADQEAPTPLAEFIAEFRLSSVVLCRHLWGGLLDHRGLQGRGGHPQKLGGRALHGEVCCLAVQILGMLLAGPLLHAVT